MEASSTIKKVLAESKIFVPTYQRAYSWETETDSREKGKQTNVFLSDLEDYIKSSTKTPYYFGHFLFQKCDNDAYGVIDGQQRLTTVVIFLSALFNRLKSLRKLSEDEEGSLEDMVKRRSVYKFDTVEYDKQLFRDYVIDRSKVDKCNLETESAKRIVRASDFFTNYLSNKEEEYLTKMLSAIQNASCTTHPVTDEAEAIQMFIFQNNRGKKPSNLEIIKAEFMYNIHLYGGEEKDSLIEEVKYRFERIYKSISSIEYRINEDDVLVYTLRVYFNSLSEANATDKISSILSKGNPIQFIKEFTHSLANSFEHLTTFFGKDERNNHEIHSLVSLGGIGIAIPFIIKAYTFGLDINDKSKLCASLESIILRHRLIRTKADLASRLNDVYQNFTKENRDINPIIGRIEWMKNVPRESWWWAYWNNAELERSMQGRLHHSSAKYLLWKYENQLASQGKGGYKNIRFDSIEKPHLEHIAPQTENPASGYCDYDEEFRNQYLDCLGNYLLLSETHNCSIGNLPFEIKRETYKHLAQQREIQDLTTDTQVWTKELINQRKTKITDFVLSTL
ncbi:DUF262 domain-containing protein [Pontibacter mangrovi]|uniref:DUF262 domain-containing protein n=1 Tax=Pontibacter mangrovi TaxID=2589816 RepID=A0A501WDN0_9BACT|nr:DUF262 domain-containing protein [Pontibacter mangrovi]TPE43616.1 DUF262 domain-containing protein [Pontibacter mangrovi]